MASTTEEKLEKEMREIKIYRPRNSVDSSTVLGFLLTFFFIGVSLYIGGNIQSFFNLPSLLIVLGGTFAISITSFQGKDIASTPNIIFKSLFKKETPLSVLIRQMLSIAEVAKKGGVLTLQKMERMVKQEPFLHAAIQYVSDGYTPKDIETVLSRELYAIKKRHEQSAEILYKASEIAPAMGLIGTLVGLVQMLSKLDDPSTIGPSMAVALLTTFYGAVLGTVVLSPMAAKLERNSLTEQKEKTIILLAAISMAKHENPRRLEIKLNSEVPPHQRVQYYDEQLEKRS